RTTIERAVAVQTDARSTAPLSPIRTPPRQRICGLGLTGHGRDSSGRAPLLESGIHPIGGHPPRNVPRLQPSLRRAYASALAVRTRHSGRRGRFRGFGYFSRLGPAVVTGAADDDPSGSGTYSQVGAA